MSAAAPEVILTTPLDKDAGNAQSSEKPAADEKKVPAPKSLLQLLPVSQDNNLNCKILTTCLRFWKYFASIDMLFALIYL